MKFAYADPPYLGYGSFYTEHHPNALDWDNPATHRGKAATKKCNSYDAGKDFEGSLNDGYEAIKDRVAAGGPGWTPGNT